MKQTIFSVLLLLVALTGCSDRSSPQSTQQQASSATPTVASHQLIERYNQLLCQGYKTMDMTGLQAVATKELAQKAYYHMAAISEGNKRLVSALKKIDFMKTDCSQPAQCTVDTKELWDFGYADILTGQRSDEVRNYTYEVRYRLENREGRWLVTDITATGEERKELPSWRKMFEKGTQ